MEKKMKGKSVVWAGLTLAVVLFVCGGVAEVGAATLADQCSNLVAKVQDCLSFATGKVAAPKKECCGSVTEIKNSNPACLCYIILQANNGSAQTKSLGIQVPRLLQLPSACKLANASVSDCPKLLNLPANSPDSKIFTNSSASSTATGTSTAGSTSSTSPDTASESSVLSKHGTKFAGLVAITTAIFFGKFSIVSAFC